MRQLRNEGGKVVDRVLAGEHLTVTRGGSPVARLSPMESRALPVEEVLRRRQSLPQVDPELLKSDVDLAVDQSL